MNTHTLYIGLACAGWLLALPATAQTDSLEVDSIVKKPTFQITYTKGKTSDQGSRETTYFGRRDRSDGNIRYPRVFGGLMARLEWSFSRPMDNGSFTLSPENGFLKYSRASNFAIDFAQIGLRFNDAFKISLATGVEWNYMRLKNNIILDRDATPLSYTETTEPYRKNVFRSDYVRTPLTLEWRGGRNRYGKRAKIAVGAIGGILIKGRQKLKGDKMKQVYRDSYNLASFQYGTFARVGFGSIGLFGKYYLNDMFENAPKGQELNNFTFGLSWEI